MSTINWGIIGCGDVTEKKSGPAFNKVADSRLVAVMRRNAAKAADYAQRHDVGKWYDDVDALMNDAKINAIYVATPPSSHLSYALQGLDKGFNVYVEKPVTRNAAEAQQMAEAVANSSNKLVVAHYRRAQPMFLYIKDLIDRRVIGDVQSVNIKLWQTAKPQLVANSAENWRVQPDISGGGYFHDLAPHQLDLMLFYFGMPLYYSGFSLNQSGLYAADDHVTGHVLFPNKVALTGSWSFNAPESEVIDQCKIIGTKGSIRFVFFGHTVSWRLEENEEIVNFPPLEHVQQPMIEQVVKYFNGERDNPSPIEEAVEVMKIIDAFSTHR
jgi:predicted dehydrogenase